MKRIPALLLAPLVLAACDNRQSDPQPTSVADATQARQAHTSQADIVGTQEPWAAEAIYFLLTDRFVDGDASNNFPDQGRDIGDGSHYTFNRHFDGPEGRSANVGYMGGDFRGLLDHAGHIRDLGFSAVWLTPIVDNPDAAFNGGDPVGYDQWGDGGKTGFHGYWAVNFYQLDEHLPSEGLDYRALNDQLKANYGLKTVLDIVGNHGSPAYTAPERISNFGQLFDQHGTLVADHQNLHPTALDDNNPLHHFFNRKPDVAQLSDLNENNPALVDYLVNSYLQWIDQGADAIRIDTIKHMPHSFWKTVTDRIRAAHPGYFIFGESWNYDAAFIAQHTQPENGGVSVLDFPMQKAMFAMFGAEQAPYSTALPAMHLNDGVYHNPYELVTFYDNHDVQRLDGTDQGFIDANNFIFTSRGIPQIYYGSETGFERGMKEHQGSRNYYGPERIAQAKTHPIYQPLKAIAELRKALPALQRGVQVNLEFGDKTAAFYRIYRQGDEAQVALVLLNKGDQAATLDISQWVTDDAWQARMAGRPLNADKHWQLAPHSVEVLVLDGQVPAAIAAKI